MTALSAAMQSHRILSFSSVQVSLKGRLEGKSLAAFTCRCFVGLLSVGWRVRQSVGSRLRENCPTQKEQSGNCTFSHAFDTWAPVRHRLGYADEAPTGVSIFLLNFKGELVAEVASLLHKLHSGKHCCHNVTAESEFIFPKQSCVFPLWATT